MTRTLKHGLGAMVAALALMTFSAHASEQEKASQKITQAGVKKLEYLNDLAMLDQQQIALGKLALEKSQNPQVRQFAEQLVKNHEQHLSNLKDWAQTRGMEVAKAYPSVDESAVGGSGFSEQTKEKLGKDAQKASDRIDKKQNEMRAEIDKLKNKTGTDFDKAVIGQITDDQKKGQKLVKDGINEYKGDATFAMLLNQTQPLLQRNLDSAKSIEKNLKG